MIIGFIWIGITNRMGMARGGKGSRQLQYSIVMWLAETPYSTNPKNKKNTGRRVNEGTPGKEKTSKKI